MRITLNSWSSYLHLLSAPPCPPLWTVTLGTCSFHHLLFPPLGTPTLSFFFFLLFKPVSTLWCLSLCSCSYIFLGSARTALLSPKPCEHFWDFGHWAQNCPLERSPQLHVPLWILCPAPHILTDPGQHDRWTMLSYYPHVCSSVSRKLGTRPAALWSVSVSPLVDASGSLRIFLFSSQKSFVWVMWLCCVKQPHLPFSTWLLFDSLRSFVFYTSI